MNFQNQELQEMMVIDINFGRNKTDEIFVNYGDEPNDLAIAFVKKHGLKEGAIKIIESHIRATIDEFKEANTDIRPQSPSLDVHESIEEKVSLQGALTAQDYDVTDSGNPSVEVLPPGPRIMEETEVKPTDNVEEFGNNASLPASVNHGAIPAARGTDYFFSEQNTNGTGIPTVNQDHEYDIQASMQQISQSLAYQDEQTSSPQETNLPTLIDSFSLSPFINKSRSSSLMLNRKSEEPVAASAVDTYFEYLGTNSSATPFSSDRLSARSSFGAARLESVEEHDMEDGSVVSNNAENYISTGKQQKIQGAATVPTSSAFPDTARTHTSQQSDDLYIGIASSEIDEDNYNVVDSADEGNAENMYNKIKRDWGAHKKVGDRSHSSTLTLVSLKSTSRCQEQIQSAAESPISPNSLNKNTNLRLYDNAAALRRRKQWMAQRAEQERMEEMKTGRFKVSANSRKIISSRGRRAYEHISDRLYSDAGRVRARRELLASTKALFNRAKEEWSCSRCGTFHPETPGSFFTSPLSETRVEPAVAAFTTENSLFSTANPMHDGVSNRRSSLFSAENPMHASVNRKERSSSRAMKICSQCGWDQGSVQPFKPVIIPLQLGSIDASEVGIRRGYGLKVDSSEFFERMSSYPTVSFSRKSQVAKEAPATGRMQMSHRHEECRGKPIIPHRSEEIVKERAELSKIIAVNKSHNSIFNEASLVSPVSKMSHTSISTRPGARPASTNLSRKKGSNSRAKSVSPGRTCMLDSKPLPSYRAEVPKHVETLDLGEYMILPTTERLNRHVKVKSKEITSRKPVLTFDMCMDMIAEHLSGGTVEEEAVRLKEFLQQQEKQQQLANLREELFEPPHGDRAIASNIHHSHEFNYPGETEEYLHEQDTTFNSFRTALQASTGSAPRRLALPPKKSEAEMQQLVDRLIAEKKEKEDRRKEAEKLAAEIDLTTGAPLFRPTIPVVVGQSFTYKKDVFTALHEEGSRHIGRLAQSRHDFLSKKALEMSRMSQVKALPMSTRLLQEASKRSVEGMYRLLLASQHLRLPLDMTPGLNDRARARIITEYSEQMMDWEREELDLNHIDVSMMIDDVQDLLTDVYKEMAKRSASVNVSSSYTSDGSDGFYGSNQLGEIGSMNMMVTFDDFKELIKGCVRKRKGLGKGYLYAPRKRADMALSMRKEERAQETFRPNIDPVSDFLAQSRNNKRDLMMQAVRSPVTSPSAPIRGSSAHPTRFTAFSSPGIRTVDNTAKSRSASTERQTHAFSSRNANGTVSSSVSIGPSISIADALHLEGALVKAKVEVAKNAIAAEQMKECTFKPKLYKPPKSVIPRYRYPHFAENGLGLSSASTSTTDFGINIGVGPTTRSHSAPPSIRGGKPPRTLVDKDSSAPFSLGPSRLSHMSALRVDNNNNFSLTGRRTPSPSHHRESLDSGSSTATPLSVVQDIAQMREALSARKASVDRTVLARDQYMQPQSSAKKPEADADRLVRRRFDLNDFDEGGTPDSVHGNQQLTSPASSPLPPPRSATDFAAALAAAEVPSSSAAAVAPEPREYEAISRDIPDIIDTAAMHTAAAALISPLSYTAAVAAKARALAANTAPVLTRSQKERKADNYRNYVDYGVKSTEAQLQKQQQADASRLVRVKASATLRRNEKQNEKRQPPPPLPAELVNTADKQKV